MSRGGLGVSITPPAAAEMVATSGKPFGSRLFPLFLGVSRRTEIVVERLCNGDGSAIWYGRKDRRAQIDLHLDNGGT